MTKVRYALNMQGSLDLYQGVSKESKEIILYMNFV